MMLKILSNKLDLFSMYILFPVGSVHDAKEKAGIGHLLEHLLFKTKNEALHNRFKLLGANINASTSKEFTSYFITVPAKHAKAGIGIMSQVVSEFGITERTLHEEKRIVRQEMAYSTSERDAFDIVFSETPFSSKILGTEKTLASITLDDLRHFYDMHYHKKGCFICVSCPIHQKDGVDKQITKHFTSHLQKDPFSSLRGDFLRDKTQDKVEIHKNKQFGLDIGLITQKYDRRFMMILEFIIHLLCGGLASKWYKVMRRETGHVYSLSIYQHNFCSTGIIRVVCTSNNNMIDVLAKACDLIAHAAQHGIIENEDELREEKNAFQNKMMMVFADVPKTVEFMAQDMFLSRQRAISPRAHIKSIKEISMADVNDIAKQIFSGSKFVMVGNNTNESDTKLARRARGILSQCRERK